MPTQKRQTGSNPSISFRMPPSTREKLNELMEKDNLNQTQALNRAVYLAWMFEIGYKKIEALRTAMGLESDD